MRQAFDQPGRDRVHCGYDDNRNRFGGLLRCADCSLPLPDDKHIDFSLYEFGDQRWDWVCCSFGVAKFDLDVFSLDITEIPKSLPESLHRRAFPIGSSCQITED